MTLTTEQSKARDTFFDWWKYPPSNNRELLTLGGYAGTGKTFLISEIRKAIDSKFKRAKIAFCTFTGKASLVLTEKLIESKSVKTQDYCGTIHGLMYRPKFGIDPMTSKKVIVDWVKNEYLDYDLIVIDEASMVNYDMFKDLESYGIPIFAVGDHGQLPPIESQNNFNLMNNPDMTLTEIKRQALDNPIIKLSFLARNDGFIPQGKYSDKVFKSSWRIPNVKKYFETIDFDNNTAVLCGFNATRNLLNSKIRQHKGFSREEPYPGERVMCLKNNSAEGIMNGQQGTVSYLRYENPEMYELSALMDNTNKSYCGHVLKSTFMKETYDEYWNYVKNRKRGGKGKKVIHPDLFDFGYALSVHKSQGSEWDRVILFEQRTRNWDDEYYARWLYTAVTRAKESLFIISDLWEY